MTILKTEKVSAYSHGIVIPVMAAGAVSLAILAWGNIKLQIFLIIYGLSTITLFTASFLYHAMKKSANERTVWRKLDRSAIFILIAGTSTPLSFLYLDGSIMKAALIMQWLLVFSGIAVIFFVNVPRKISTIIYLTMGTACSIPIIASIRVIPPGILVLLVTGGLFYTAGAVVYAVKKPNLRIGFHELFHLFVIAGAVFHMIMIISGVTIYLDA
ncbi:MAG: hemolysin III family protein [Spirochaetes bacterium]|nr:hemolysin III family protein [Spirochaetota bacterium]